MSEEKPEKLHSDKYTRLSEEFDQKFEEFKLAFDRNLTNLVSQIAATGLTDIIGPNASNSDLCTIEEESPTDLEPSITIEDVLLKLKQNKFKNILLLVGAGISTSAGIPGLFNSSSHSK